MNAAVKRCERLLGFGTSDKCSDDPHDGRDRSGDNRRFRINYRIVADKLYMGKPDGHGGSGDHGADFAPGINAPPVPSQDVNRAGAEADIQYQIPTLLNGSQLHGGVAGAKHQQHGEYTADEHVMFFRGVSYEESFVQIIHQVRTSPVELRAHG